jgi:hypothetical protein
MPAGGEKRKRSLADLQGLLMADEILMAHSSGIASVRRLGSHSERPATLFVTDRRVGVVSTELDDLKLTEFSYGVIRSVEYKQGIFCGEISLLSSGMRTRFHHMPRAAVGQIAELIREQVTRRSQ